MIEIDASPGGQVLRTTLGLSALLGKEVALNDIRKNRPKAGLFPQHLTAVKSLAILCGAKVQGDFLGSTRLVFSPGGFKGGRLNINIGTAGSSMLLLQQFLLPSLLGQTSLRVTGGTDVLFAPSFNYYKEVLFPLLSGLNAKFELNLFGRGFFPRGGGVVSFRSHCIKKLKQIFFAQRNQLAAIKVFSQSSNLPSHVVKSQANAAKKALLHLGVDFIEVFGVEQNPQSTGSSIDLVACFEGGACFGANAVLEKGLTSEQVGALAAKKLLEELSTPCAVDSHLADQLLPFMALNGFENKIVCARQTEHVKSNIAVLEKILGVKFRVEQKNGCEEISVQGSGFF